MGTDKIITKTQGTAAAIARQIVRHAEQNIHPSDVRRAVDRAIDAFARQIRKAAHAELDFHANTTLIRRIDLADFEK